MVINIRSGKHCKSTALGHAKDFRNLMENKDVEEFTKINGASKPILIRFVDGGPDQNPHNVKVIQAAIDQFQTFNFDVVLVTTNAPGRSCFNQVERKMAPLSKKLVGVLLSHDHFGSHLDSQQRTTDVELEKRNFKNAGEVLAEIWSEVVIDGHKTFTFYINPEDSDIEPPATVSQMWLTKHVRVSQYLLQIVKCDNKKCCKKFRSNWLSIVDTFLPPPIRISNCNSGTNERQIF